MDTQSTNAGQVDFTGWLIRLLTWDGVLPVCVILTPLFVEAILANRRGAIEITAVALPIVGFLTRLVVGTRHINRNRCGRRLRTVQRCALCVGVFVLVFIDAILILSRVMPQGAFGRGDMAVFMTMTIVYFVSMAIAMYPGRAAPVPEVFRPNVN